MALALKMPVKELLSTHSSRELREYMAYEMHAGPIGDSFTRERVAEMHYLLQWNNYLLGAWVTKEGEKNPVPEPEMVSWKDDEPEDDEEEE